MTDLTMKEAKLDTPEEIEASISTISALAAFLVGAQHPTWVEVVVSPIGKKNWQVAVRYQGFVVSESAQSLSTALRQMLTSLTNRVAKKLEVGQELLKG